MREERLLRLRAHHGMCLAFFEGKGYSDGFTAHMENVLAGMKQNPILQIVTTGDMICKKCPNLREDICISQDKVEEYDRKVLLACGLEENCVISWEEFFHLVEKSILKPGRREGICGHCQWGEICRRKEQERYGGYEGTAKDS